MTKKTWMDIQGKYGNHVADLADIIQCLVENGHLEVKVVQKKIDKRTIDDKRLDEIISFELKVK